MSDTKPYGRLDISDLQPPSEYASNTEPEPTPAAQSLGGHRLEERRQGERRRGDRRREDRRQGDRRRSPRVTLEIWVEQQLGDDLIYLRTGNLSATGLSFRGIIPYPLGTDLSLRIPLPGHAAPLRARGRVVNLVADGSGMGVAFTQISDADQRRLEEFLSA